MNKSVEYYSAKCAVVRPTLEFSDLLKIVAAHFDMYSRAATFAGPWIARQSSSMFLVPDREQVKAALGPERAGVCFRARSAFIDALLSFMQEHKGKKTLITPNPSTHHSAQFPAGTFEISLDPHPPALVDDRGPRKKSGPVHKIEFAGSPSPVWVENLQLTPEQVKFIILRPRMGRLGTASVNRWEVLVFKSAHGWLIEHADSMHNPRFSGII